MSSLPEIPSPCIGVCRLDKDTQLCEGCMRTRDEIKIWRSADNQTRVQIVRELRKRRIEAGYVTESDRKPRRRKSQVR